MKIERVTNKPRVTIEQFAEEHDLVMVVQEPVSPGCPGLDGCFSAHFKGTEVALGGFLYSFCGHHVTEADAINEYAKRISGKTILLSCGKRIDVPELAVYHNRQHPMKETISPSMWCYFPKGQQ